MVKVCECCGHPLPDLAVQLELTKRQRQMFEALRRAGKAGITLDRIMEVVYGDDSDGGPDSTTVLHVQRTKMKGKLAKFGLQITTTKGHGSLWRLEAIK